VKNADLINDMYLLYYQYSNLCICFFIHYYKYCLVFLCQNSLYCI